MTVSALRKSVLSRKSPSAESAPIEIIVKPRSDEGMGDYIKELSGRLRTIQVPDTGMTRKAWEIIESGVRKLGYTGDPRIVPALLETVYKYPHSDMWVADAFLYYLPRNPEIRNRVVATAKKRGLPSGTYWTQHLLEELGCSEQEFKQIISVCLRSEEANVQSAGAHAAQRHPDGAYTFRLIAIATDPNNKARIEAGRALAYNRTDEGVGTLKELLKDDSELIRENIEAVIRGAYVNVPWHGEQSDDEYLSELINQIRDANAGDWILFSAVREIVKTRSKEGVETLKGLLKDPDKDATTAEIDEGVKVLKGLLNSQDEDVRKRTASSIHWACEAFPGRPLREDDFPELYRESVENRRKSTLEWLQKSKALETYAAGATKRQWARKIKLAGVPNLHRVSGDLYRGAQPSEEGMKQLEKLGIKTVVNLRSFHSDRDEMKGTKLGYEHIYMKAWNAEDEELVRFLEIVSDPNRQPAFVHCQFGADRTGTMCAVYRIAVQGWSKDEAIEEMTKGGFGFHTIWANLVEYIRNLDIEKIKRKAGLSD